MACTGDEKMQPIVTYIHVEEGRVRHCRVPQERRSWKIAESNGHVLDRPPARAGPYFLLPVSFPYCNIFDSRTSLPIGRVTPMVKHQRMLDFFHSSLPFKFGNFGMKCFRKYKYDDDDIHRRR